MEMNKREGTRRKYQPLFLGDREMRNVRIAIWLVVAILTMSVSAQAALLDFVLTGNEHLDVTTHYSYGHLWDFSTANVLSGGIENTYVNDEATLNISGGSSGWLYAYNNSVANVSGGNVGTSRAYNRSTVNIFNDGIVRGLLTDDISTANISGGSMSSLVAEGSSIVNMSGGSMSSLDAYESSTVHIAGGSMYVLKVYGSSTADISGGSVYSQLDASNSSTVNISGGSVHILDAYHSSTVIFNGYDFVLGNGLSWDIDGKTILGTGILTGKWFDDTSFEIPIGNHYSTATIMAIPEPATLLLLGLGALMLRRRH
jgi:hypothetical protein